MPFVLIIETIFVFILNIILEFGIACGIAGILLDTFSILWLLNYIVGPILSISWIIVAIFSIICLLPLTFLVSLCESLITTIPGIGDWVFIIYPFLVGISIGIGVGTGIVYAGVGTFVIALFVDKLFGLRVKEKEETLGLDFSQHGESALSKR